MSFVNTKEMLKSAYEGGYAVGAFNFYNMEILKAITDACALEHAPVIIQVLDAARDYAGHRYIVDMAKAAAECHPDIPMALHLDHGADFETCKSCIDEGFSSVMIDGSRNSFEKNIEITKRVVEYAHAYNVTVEAELGTIAGAEGNAVSLDEMYTRPEEVEEFVDKTGCDSLAISIGTSHGAFKTRAAGEIALRLDILKECEKRLPGFPIVLHGASSIPEKYIRMFNTYGGNLKEAAGIPEDQLKQAAKLAVCKINVDSDQKLAMAASIRKYMSEHPGQFDVRDYMTAAYGNIVDMVRHKVSDVFGCSGRV